MVRLGVEIKVQVKPKFVQKNTCMDPPKVCKNGGPKWPFICVLSYLCVTSPSAEMVRLGVQIKVQVKANFFYKNTCMDPPKVCTKFGFSSTSLS